MVSPQCDQNAARFSFGFGIAVGRISPCVHAPRKWKELIERRLGHRGSGVGNHRLRPQGLLCGSLIRFQLRSRPGQIRANGRRRLRFPISRWQALLAFAHLAPSSLKGLADKTVRWEWRLEAPPTDHTRQCAAPRRRFLFDGGLVILAVRTAADELDEGIQTIVAYRLAQEHPVLVGFGSESGMAGAALVPSPPRSTQLPFRR